MCGEKVEREGKKQGWRVLLVVALSSLPHNSRVHQDHRAIGPSLIRPPSEMTAQKQLESSASSSFDAVLVATPTTSAKSTTLEQTPQKPNHVWTPGQELAAKLVFGGMGCMIAVVFTNPVDVIKVRLQLQGEAVSSPTPSLVSSSPHLTSISRMHVTPALIPPSGSHLSSAASTVISNTIHHRDSALLAHNTLDASSRIASTPKTLRLIPLFRDILRNEGPRVFMAGLAPAVLREGVYSTIRLGSYDLFKGIYSGMGSAGFRGGEETTTLVKVMSGLTSGMLGSTIANPTDLIKGNQSTRNKWRAFDSLLRIPNLVSY